MEDSIFTKIINKQVPANIIYEDAHTIALLDINPRRKAHTLVISKAQIDQYIDLEDDDYIALWITVKKVAMRLRTVLETDRVHVGIMGTDVPHTHVHLIPFNNSDELYEDIGYKADKLTLDQLTDKLKFS